MLWSLLSWTGLRRVLILLCLCVPCTLEGEELMIDILVHAIRLKGLDANENYQPRNIPNLPANPLAMSRNHIWRYTRTILLALSRYR